MDSQFPPEDSLLNKHSTLSQIGDFNLPTEVFLAILKGAFDERHGITSGVPPVVVATHVCSHWRRVVVNTPSFWTVISTQHITLPWAVESLRRSRSDTAVPPLSLEFIVTGEETYLFAREALGEIYRVRSLAISILNRYFEHLVPFLCEPAPLLHECILSPLYLDTDTEEDQFMQQVLPEDLFGSYPTPSLRHLSVSGYHMCWYWPNLRNLRTFSFWQRDGDIPLFPLFEILSNSPQIRELYLTLVHPFHWHLGANRRFSDLPKPSLPELNHMFIDVQVPFHLSLVNIISLPTYSTTTIHIRGFSRRDVILPESFPWLEDSGSLNMYIGRGAALTIETIGRSPGVRHVLLNIGLTTYPLPLSYRILRRLPANGLSKVVSLTISPPSFVPPIIESWQELGIRVPNIQRLTLKSLTTEERVMTLVDFLAGEEEPDDLPQPWPNLNRVRISHDWDEFQIVYTTLLRIAALCSGRVIRFKIRFVLEY